MTPSNYVFKTGSNVTFTCQASIVPSNISLNYSFFGLSGVVDLCRMPRVVCYNNTAIITNATASDTGVYNCRVQARNSLRGVSGSFIFVLGKICTLIM